MSSFKYDVAISFLAADQGLAEQFHARLSEGLTVFYFPRSQEALAGTDGLESMRAPFFDQARIVVVLYREPWGATPWTGVEQTAIQERCLRDGWEGLFLLMLEDEAPPKWVPTHRVRFNYKDFGFEQAIGAIKARVQEAGGRITVPTPAEVAEISRKETEYLAAVKRLRTGFDHGVLETLTGQLIAHIEAVCATVPGMQFAKDHQTSCHLRAKVSMVVRAEPRDTGFSIAVLGYDGRFAIPPERQFFYFDGDPQKRQEHRWVPHLSRAGEHGWAAKGSETFLSTQAVAEAIVNSFTALNARAERGEFHRFP